MPLRRARRSWRCLLVAGLVLLLAGGLVACDGSSDSESLPATTETDQPPAVPDKPRASATPVAPAETPRPSRTTPEGPIPRPPAEPVEPDAPAASPRTDEPTTTASEEVPAPVAETTPLLYDTYDLSGAVSEPGHYAFLADPGDPTSVVTTYEELRDGTATALLIHTRDAHGVSQEDFYASVAPGDLFEWSQADDCFVRYQVMEEKPDPGGPEPRSLLAVAWMTYAFTGCSGTVATTAAVTLEWGDLPNLGGSSLTTPIQHGPFQLVPEGWAAATQQEEAHELPRVVSDLYLSLQTPTLDRAKLAQLPYWRDPQPPAGGYFKAAIVNLKESSYGYCAWYETAEGAKGFTACGYPFNGEHPFGVFSLEDGRVSTETRVIAGRPALAAYSPQGPNHDRLLSTRVWVHDQATESLHVIRGDNANLWGANVDPVIGIARSLFERPPGTSASPARPARPATPCPDIECIELLPGAFEHETWEAGASIDWTTGIFFMDTATGRVEGYRPVEPTGEFGFFTSPHGRWVHKVDPSGPSPRFKFLLDRQTGRSWRWGRGLDFMAGSPQHLLFAWSHRQPHGEYIDGGYIVVDDNLQEVARFAIPREGYELGRAFFSPDGRKVALASQDIAYLLDVEMEHAGVLIEAQATEQHGTVYDVYLEPLRNGREILITTQYYYGPEEEYRYERHRFNWEGQELPWEQHWTHLSPDGRYAAWQEGGLWQSEGGLFGTWPSVVVVADVKTGTPCFRVHSASLQYGDRFGGSRWLPSGEGILMRVRDGFAIAYVRPEPRLVDMPVAPDGWSVWSGLVPAPAGDDRFFSYDRLTVYDAVEDRWATAHLVPGSSGPGHHNPWGATDREMRFILDHAGHGGAHQHFAGSPRIEFPPFSNELRFRVHGTANCLHLRTEPGTEGELAACLGDGTRVLLSQSQEWAGSAEYGRHPSVAPFYYEAGWDVGVYVRTADGLEGWVAHAYLELD